MFQPLLAKVGQLLDQGGISYMVIGAQAVLVYGEPRLTRDIDITIMAGAGDANRIANLLTGAGIDPLEHPESFVAETLVLPCIDRESQIRIDVTFGASQYERAALRRTRVVEMAGHPVRFISPEDLVIHKVLAGRPRDIDDVLGLLLKQPDLDHTSIRSWLDGFDAELDTDLRRRFDELVEQARR
jgi:predicted nucleotidyltransferase